MKIAVTGHRPGRIIGREGEIKKWIRDTLKQQKELNGGKVSLISGMAEGVDQIAALAALSEDIKLECYFAYKHKLSDIEQTIADKAAEVLFLEDKYSGGCFLRRDRRMIEDCDLLLVVWDGNPNGGTYYTYMNALEKDKPILMFDWTNVIDRLNAVPHVYPADKKELKRGLRRATSIIEDDQINEFIGGLPHENT